MCWSGLHGSVCGPWFLPLTHSGGHVAVDFKEAQTHTHTHTHTHRKREREREQLTQIYSQNTRGETKHLQPCIHHKCTVQLM